MASDNISKSGGFEGLGFVVTINSDQANPPGAEVVLERDGRARWSMATSPGRSMCRSPYAILVQQVAANSPSALIGLKPGTIPATIDGKALLVGGDILLSVMGMRIGDSSYEEIQERLSRAPRGLLVRLTVLRDGQQVELTAPR